mmetsp:Transcript_2953/g.8880  ORF Transcript_2953/g.8880 Transcript_2953/m.8880 type:complete len:224 (+) Transcript_2953:297-968(+)
MQVAVAAGEPGPRRAVGNRDECFGVGRGVDRKREGAEVLSSSPGEDEAKPQGTVDLLGLHEVVGEVLRDLPVDELRDSHLLVPSVLLQGLVLPDYRNHALPSDGVANRPVSAWVHEVGFHRVRVHPALHVPLFSDGHHLAERSVPLEGDLHRLHGLLALAYQKGAQKDTSQGLRRGGRNWGMKTARSLHEPPPLDHPQHELPVLSQVVTDLCLSRFGAPHGRR